MKRLLLICLIVGTLGFQVALSAEAPAELAKEKNCLTCHAIAFKIMGPAYRDVAAKYAGQRGIEDKLVQKVLKGGSGAWGVVPMPANSQVNETEARILVKWVLSQK
jgi:cytochrome c